MKFYIALALLVASVAGAPAENDSRLAGAGAVPALLVDNPHVVVITEKSKVLCGGFIYNDRTVVTTKSCLARATDTTYAAIRVKAGTVTAATFTTTEQERSIVTTSVKTPTDGGDLAVFTLTSPFLLDGINLKAITYGPVDPTVTEAVVSGWGATEDGGLESTILFQAPVTQLKADCSIYGASVYNKNYMICASDPSSSPCAYDEGAPLVQTVGTNKIVVGIMSKTEGCPTTATYKPAIYTRLSSYYDFLINNAGQQPAP